jgi:hypothetical protein
MTRFSVFVLALVIVTGLVACGDRDKSMEKTAYLELPGSHFRGYAYAVGTVTEKVDGQYKVRIDSIEYGLDSDHPLLADMRLGRFVVLPEDEVQVAEELPFEISLKRGQALALENVVSNALSLNRVTHDTIALLNKAAAGSSEVACVIDLINLNQETALYIDNQLQLNTAAQAISGITKTLDNYDKLDHAKGAMKLQYAPGQGACVHMSNRMIREAEFDLRNYVDSIRAGDSEEIKASMTPVAPLIEALLDYRTAHFTQIPERKDKDIYIRESLATLTNNLRNYYAYNYFRDFRHDLDKFTGTKQVIDRFQQDQEASSILADLLGGDILTERNLNEYLNYFKLNKELPSQMSQTLDEEDFYDRASQGFVVVDPTLEQRVIGLELYLQQFPEGEHAEQARSELDALRAEGGFTAPPLPLTAPEPMSIQPGVHPGLPDYSIPAEPQEIPSQLPPEKPIERMN